MQTTTTTMTTAKGKEQRKKAKRMRDSSLRSEPVTFLSEGLGLQL
jgi:hypothetical protein